MSTRSPLAATSRTVTGKKLGPLRRSGRVPGVIFGAGQASQPISVDGLDWEILRRKHVTRNSILDVTVDGGAAETVLVQAIVEHPVNRRPVHIDLHRVNLADPITADVRVVLVGSAPAAADGGGTVMHLHETLHVRALPEALPEAIEVDVSGLADFDAIIHVGDVRAPRGVTILTDATQPLVRVQAPRVEAAPEAPAAAEPVAEAAPEA